MGSDASQCHATVVAVIRLFAARHGALRGIVLYSSEKVGCGIDDAAGVPHLRLDCVQRVSATA